MNYIVFLEAGELEKILSGYKTMLLKECSPARLGQQPVKPGDHLYFLRDQDECILRAEASVSRVLAVANAPQEELANTLKEMQSRLQLTEEQYNHWSTRQQVILVEFESAHKIGMLRLASHKIADRSDWLAFEELSMLALPCEQA